MKHGTFVIQEEYPVHLGPVGRLSRRIVWGLLRPYIDDLTRQVSDRTAELRAEAAYLRSDLLATNHRITWLENELAATKAARSKRSTP